MARSDLLISLVKAATTGDRPLVRKAVEAMVAEERAKRHEVLANQLEAYLRTNGANAPEPPPVRPGSPTDLVHEIEPQRLLSDLVLAANVRASVAELIEEHHRSDILHSYNLVPRHRILLVGPPGNGKTSLAEAVAAGLMVPLIVVRYDGLITSYLGETASRLRRLFDFSHGRKCVLFFDEFDTIGKERGDIHETGEIKRVVSSLLMQIDGLPSHVVVVCATNHPELLDRAVWRRFQLRLDLERPSLAQIEEFFSQIQRRLKLPLGVSDAVLARHMRGSSFSDLEQFVEDVARRYVLALPDGNIRAVTMDAIRRRKRTSRGSVRKTKRG
jgi:SpoVK/Ycf46/Vps4 family AAA+-type ATPase